MTGIMKVRELNETGLFVGELDFDNSFKGKSNPKGYFVMLIEPLEGFDKPFINYQKIRDDAYLIEGEAYIIEGRKNIVEKRVDEWINSYRKRDFDFVEKIIW